MNHDRDTQPSAQPRARSRSPIIRPRSGRVSAVLAAVLLAGATAVTLTPTPASAAPSPVGRTAEPPVTDGYLSAPPRLGPRAPVSRPSTRRAVDPPQAPTRGHVTGRVLAPDGKPLAGLLVQGVRFNDLGPGIDFSEESPVIARTGADGRFRLRQLRERYLIRVCDAEAGADQCGGDAAPDRYAATYVGPDGLRSSWVTQTRLFAPRTPTRGVGTITMRRYAVLNGTFTGGPGRTVRLLRGNGTEAATTRTDGRGRFRFRVVPGRYRVEADRHEGLRTVATVPGFRSRLLSLRAFAPTAITFETKPAAVVSGLVTDSGRPLPDELVVITDAQARFAAGAPTDENGRYVVESLRPGTYRVALSSAFSGFTPTSRPVTVSTGSPARADLETTRGGAVSLSVVDPGGDGTVDLEIRTDEGLVAKMFQARPADESGGTVAFGGLRPGRYDVLVRRSVQNPFSDDEQTDFPWASRSVTVADGRLVRLGAVTLDRPTLNLSGSLPKGSEVKITPVPLDAFLRAAFVDGPTVTSMALNWTELADSAGRYTSRGLVPGRYAVAVTTSLLNPEDGPSTYGGNVAATHHGLTVGDTSTTADFTAPVGGVVTGVLRYEGTSRPLIAPVGFGVSDRGDQSTLFPTVSGPQRYGEGFRVDRLHPGPVTGRLLDIVALRDAAEENSILVPDVLLRSAPIAEARTPYWLTARPVEARVASGKVTDLGTIRVRLAR
jgi:Carboxypeptidase regulatory-like domain